MQEYTSGSSIRAEQTPPRKSPSKQQMVDFRGFPLSSEEGNPLVTNKSVYSKSEYSADNSPSVVLNSSSYREDGISSQNIFSKGLPAALPIVERFSESSEVSRSLLGINRETTQQGLFGNVSTYGLDEKDWKISGTNEQVPEFWYQRPSSAGNYFSSKFEEDTRNSAISIFVYPSPFTVPSKPSLEEQLITTPTPEQYRGWGQYLNSIIAQYLIEYMVNNFTKEQRTQYNLDYFLSKYSPTVLPNDGLEFNQLYWDKLWLDINQRQYGADSEYPILPSGRAFNFNLDQDNLEELDFTDASLWAQPGQEANIFLPGTQAQREKLSGNYAWYSYFFSATRVYYPANSPSDKGHYRIQTNPIGDLWEKYFGINYSALRQDLKNWKFGIYTSLSLVPQFQKDLKLPFFVLNTPLIPDPTNRFSDSWPTESSGVQINLPADRGNRIGGSPGISSEASIKSVRAFRYQPGRISGFTYGSKASEIGAGPGTKIEWGVENDTDAYFFRLIEGTDFQIVRRSTIPLDETAFLSNAGYIDNTKEIVINGIKQYETVIEQKQMNGDPLSGEGETGYILNLDTVTMYKIEFGWYGAIGARFYAYIPTGNGDCRWVSLHTFVIENQLGQPCLADPFFYFKYRLSILDSSTIRINQFLYKFGASYYIDGYDQGTLYSSSVQSKQRLLSDPKFTQSKTRLNAIDWTVLMGIKPKQYLYNRFGAEIYNKKEIFPKSFSVFSAEDCEIKIIRQKGCPEFAYLHQEGYTWSLLPTNRRIRGLFNVTNYNKANNTSIGISADDASTYTATLTFKGPVLGYKDPSLTASYPSSVIGSQPLRVVGNDIFSTVVTNKLIGQGTNSIYKLARSSSFGFLSTSSPLLTLKRVYLPFTYPLTGNFENGYEIEFDYYRRDQILLSSIDVLSDEFYIFWTGGSRSGIDSSHLSSMRFGFVWPKDDNNTSDPIHRDKPKSQWGVEQNASYDSGTYPEGLPVDFVQNYGSNTLYIETNPNLNVNTYNLEVGEYERADDSWNLSTDLSVPGIEGGFCRGLACKVGKEVRDASIIEIQQLDENGNNISVYYIQSSEPWPSQGGQFTVRVDAPDIGFSGDVNVGAPIAVVIDGSFTWYRLPILDDVENIANLGVTETASISYSISYIATVDSKSKIRSILVSKVIPNVPFVRVFIQARQGASLGGVWIGQKTPDGIKLDPFTPHHSTVNIKDSGTESNGEVTGQNGGAQKIINTYTQNDSFGVSTAPTQSIYPELKTNKSIHSSPKKCGSFLSKGGTNSAGILTPSDYPIRWLTNDQSGLPLGSFFIPKNQSVEISLGEIFNVFAESVVNSDNANIATMFIARSVNSHSPADSEKEIYMTLNYDEQ